MLSVLIGQGCAASAVGDVPSRLAVREIPASFLEIYEQVGASCEHERRR